MEYLSKQHIFNSLESYKVAVVGDVHLQSTTPRSRRDNYFMSTITELDKIFSVNDIMLFLGDVFDTPILSGKHLYQFINLIKYYTKLGKKFYTIVGNHDLYSYNIDSIPKTSLGLMFITGLIKNLKRIKIHDVLVDGMYFYPKVKPNPRLDYDKTSILLGHYFYEFNLDPEYSLTEDMIKDMNYDYVLLGHDHKPYPEKKIGKTKLLRGGSIARNSADSFNLTRKPSYYQFIITKKGVESYSLQEIPNCLSGKEIFIDSVFDNVMNNDLSSVTDVESILERFTKKTVVSKYTMKHALNDLSCPEKPYDYLQSKYRENNLSLI